MKYMTECVLNNEDCPRCGCWTKKMFDCNCGQVHAEYCGNCGRYVAPALKRDEYIEPDSLVPPCTLGQVLHAHEHDWEALIKAFKDPND